LSLEEEQMRLFTNLIPRSPSPASSEAYIKLQRKLEEYANNPHVLHALIRRVSPRSTALRVEALEKHTLKLLQSYERWQYGLFVGDRRAESKCNTLESRIAGNMAEARRLVFLVQCRKFWRYVSTIRIQRTMLRLLYVPRPGGVPRISRALLAEGYMTIGDGDPDDE
jgi:hypothetical protein